MKFINAATDVALSLVFGQSIVRWGIPVASGIFSDVWESDN